MQRFQNILVYLESGSCDPNSTAVIDDLARRNGATLTLISAVDEPSRLRQLWSRSDDDDELVAELERELTATAAAFDVPTRTRVVRGVAAIEIVRCVLRGEADLVITPDSETPPAPSTTRLLRKCPCPVWVIRPDAAAPTGGLCVVAAVNPDPGELELNTLILELASSMAERSGGVLHIVHAWEMIGSATKAGRSVSARFGVTNDELVIRARSRRADALETVLDGLRTYDIEQTVHLVHGAPETVIPDVVHEQGSDVLVMGTVARTGINGFLIGNTAERVLTSTACSFVAVKPNDFDTPITITD